MATSPNYYDPYGSQRGWTNPYSGNAQPNQADSQQGPIRDSSPPNYYSPYGQQAYDTPDTPNDPTPPGSPPPVDNQPPANAPVPGTQPPPAAPETPTSPGPATGAPGAGNGRSTNRWDETTFTGLFGRPSTLNELIGMEDRITQLGGKVNRNASGQYNGKITTPDGRIIDIIRAAGMGGQGFQWLEGGGLDMGTAAPYMPPMIMPNGMVPPGMPYQPTSQQTGMQDDLIQTLLTQPTFSPQFMNQLNEQQKELLLNRGRGGAQAARQDAASRGTYRGGASQARNRRMSTDMSSQLLQSQRDVALRTTAENRTGFINGLAASDNIFSGRENRDLDRQRFLEAIRQYGGDDMYRWAMANLNAENAYIGAVL